MPVALPGRISECPCPSRPLPNRGQTTHPDNFPLVPTYLPPAAQGFGLARPQGCGVLAEPAVFVFSKLFLYHL